MNETHMNETNMNQPRVAVVGGGAAGLVCACLAAQNGAQVTLFEKNRSERTLDSERYFDNAYLGKKLLITGKGRCNVTNACTVNEFTASVISNPKFLYAAFRAFPPEKVMTYFEALGVPLKTERGGRVFPASDKALDVLRALKGELKRTGVRVINRKIDTIEKTGEAFRLTDERGETYAFDRTVICTGGRSYPQTGSTGDGYRFAREAGHSVVPANPSLVPLVESGETCRSLMGLSLRNVQLTVFENEKKIYTDFGEMLFTHFGLSGPLVLSASAHMRHFGSKSYRVEIDLKPALDEKTLDKRLLSDFDKHKNSDFVNALGELLPRKIIPAVIEKSGIDPREKVNTITKKQRASLLRVLKCFPVEISGKRPIAEAIVTTGGVSVREVSPKTMESKKCSGLYFAGEVLDVDAYTGGFNLQIAWSTGRLAGLSAAQEEK